MIHNKILFDFGNQENYIHVYIFVNISVILRYQKKMLYCSRRPGSRLNNIIDVTGASQYHGFLPVLVRNCISTLTTQQQDTCCQTYKKVRQDMGSECPDSNPRRRSDQEINIEEGNPEAAKVLEYVSDISMINSQWYNSLETKFPLPLATALFSFLYHLASYESGGEALVSCGMMESLLQVINWHGVELEHITV